MALEVQVLQSYILASDFYPFQPSAHCALLTVLLIPPLSTQYSFPSTDDALRYAPCSMRASLFTGVKNRKGSELSALIGVNLRLIYLFRTWLPLRLCARYRFFQIATSVSL